jgi:RNA polymerase sigma-70 factor, ECF subfamily
VFPSTHWSQFDAPQEGAGEPNGLHWDRFLRVYREPIHGWFLSRRVQASDADDLAQTVLLKLFQKLGSYSPEKGPFRPWLVTLLRHTMLDARRTGQRRPGDVARGDDGALDRLADDESLDDLGSRIESCGESLMKRALATVKAETSSVQWTAFERHEMQKRPAGEVGAEVGLSAGAVYQARYRILQKIRAEYLRLAGEE